MLSPWINKSSCNHFFEVLQTETCYYARRVNALDYTVHALCFNLFIHLVTLIWLCVFFCLDWMWVLVCRKTCWFTVTASMILSTNRITPQSNPSWWGAFNPRTPVPPFSTTVTRRGFSCAAWMSRETRGGRWGSAIKRYSCSTYNKYTYQHIEFLSIHIHSNDIHSIQVVWRFFIWLWPIHCRIVNTLVWMNDLAEYFFETGIYIFLCDKYNSYLFAKSKEFQN